MICMRPHCGKKGEYYATYSSVDLVYCPECAHHILLPFIKSRRKYIVDNLLEISKDGKAYTIASEKICLCKEIIKQIKRIKRVAKWQNVKSAEWK